MAAILKAGSALLSSFAFSSSQMIQKPFNRNPMLYVVLDTLGSQNF